MAKLKTQVEYEMTLERIEELLPFVTDDTSLTDKYAVELNILSELVDEYEEEHYPISTPSLIEIMKLRLVEMGLTQASFAELIGVSPSRVSDILNQRCEPTLQVARKISQTLKIDPSIVLGV